MAYKLNELRIAPGGLNLLMPSDSPQQNESLDLTDWWPGAAGTLEQTPEKTAVASPASYLDSVMKTGANIYSAGNGNLYLGAGAIDPGFVYGNAGGGPYPVGMIAFQGYAWFTSQTRQSKAVGSTVTAWTIPGPATGPLLADQGPFTGMKIWPLEDHYFVTWVIPALGETNPSPENWLTVGSEGDVEGHGILITQPAGHPTEATGWNIYRRVPGYGRPTLDASTPPYLLNIEGPIPIGTTTYVDNGREDFLQDDTSLLNFGQIMEADHDAAPPAAVMANQTYNGRIVVANSAAHPNRMWWTPALQPAFFRGSGDAYDGDWVDVGTDSSDEIRALIVRPNNMLVIYRAKSIWTHQGDLGESNAVLQPACLDVGIAGPRAVASTAAGDYFVGTGGDAVYRFNNDWPIKLSQKIESLLRGLPSENFAGHDTTLANLCSVGHYRGRVYVCYKTSAQPNSGFILHIESERWFAFSSLFTAFYDAGDSLLAASAAGLWSLEKAYGNTYTNLKFQSQYLDCGLPDHEKTFADLVITSRTHSQNLNVTIRQNKNGTPATDEMVMPVLNSFAATVPVKQIIPLIYPAGHPSANKPIRAFNISIRITGTGHSSGPPTVIESPMLLHYYLEARRGKLFDSGNTNHGLEGVGTIDQIELDIDSSSGPAILRLASDIPGGVMADRAGPVNIAQTNGRQVLRIQIYSPVSGLPSPVDGRLFRHQIGTATDFQLYGYKVRILPIGVYLDGSNPGGDFWYTTPLSPGAP